MDPKTNLAEQIQLARRIIELCDVAERDDREPPADVIADLSMQLSENVLALHEWRRKGGFDPYGS